MSTCACGCGAEVRGRFQRGHNWRLDRSLLSAAIAKRNAQRSGELHPRWLGDAVDYKQLHKWVSRRRERTGTCEQCGTVPVPRADGRAGTDWANVSGEYRRELDDYRELCHACNMAEVG